jgi:glycosyltransferase involved in cell wall biosynthesis
MKIFIVIPAFNESKRIGLVLNDLVKINLPIIVVDDGSSDKTYQVASGYKEQLKNLLVLRHKINLGKGAALKTGCQAAILKGAEAFIIMDSDGQHKVSDIYKFIETLNSEKYDVVFGSRNLSLGAPLVRFIGNKLASVLIIII